jgi:lipid A disaccharide synthetase
MIITIPGTNTAEVAIIGTPMISVFPLASSEMIPLEGIWDLIGRIPVLGYFFKRYYVKIVQSLTGFFAIPNIKAGRMVTPEFKGDIPPYKLAQEAEKLLKDPSKMAVISKDLKTSLGIIGAAERIAEEINETLLKTS